MKLWSAIQDRLSTWVGKVTWHSNRVLTEGDIAVLRDRLKEDYYIVLTRHSGHLSSYAISLLHFFMTGKKGYYAHVLMNAENTVRKDADYRFIEATGKGVHYSGLREVFDAQCSSVALMIPKSMTLTEWTAALDKAKTQLGKPYDTLFDLSNDQALSCVEVIRVALQNVPDYATDFANFEELISKSGNLDPHMFYECPDFEVIYEIRH